MVLMPDSWDHIDRLAAEIGWVNMAGRLTAPPAGFRWVPTRTSEDQRLLWHLHRTDRHSLLCLKRIVAEQWWEDDRTAGVCARCNEMAQETS